MIPLELRKTSVRFAVCLGILEPDKPVSFQSDDGEALAHCKRPIYVGLRCDASLWEPLCLSLNPQLGVYHYPRLQMERHPRASSLPVDDMGPYRLLRLMSHHKASARS